MARGVQPTPQQLADERHITLHAATDELLRLDIPEAEQLDYLARAVAGNPTLSAIVRRLQRSNRIEDADHLELHTAVREVAS